MDIREDGKLMKLASGLGRVKDSSTLVQDLERVAMAIHIERPGGPDMIVAGSANHDDVLVMYTDADSASVCMTAARVLIDERADMMGRGAVVSLPPGSARGVRGSTGSFATFLARDVDLPKWTRFFAVHAPQPICEWEKATLAEAKSAVPDLVSRFAKRRKPGQTTKPAGTARKTRLRKRS